MAVGVLPWIDSLDHEIVNVFLSSMVATGLRAKPTSTEHRGYGAHFSSGRSSLLPLGQSVVKGMNAIEIIDAVLGADEPVRARALLDASVHLPRRGSRWIAAFRDATGRQAWKSTGLRDREAALAIAQEWEQQAKRKRLAQGAVAPKPTIRVRPGSGEETLGLLTQAQVALILRISQRAVREIERRAFEKLRQHPALRRFWREHQRGEIKEAAPQASSRWQLTQGEIIALYALATTPIERRALSKMIALTLAGNSRDRSSPWQLAR